MIERKTIKIEKRFSLACFMAVFADALAVSTCLWADDGITDDTKPKVTKPAPIEKAKPADEAKPADKKKPVKVKPPKSPVKAPKNLTECDEAYMKGSYSNAAAGYKTLLGDKSTSVQASIGLARALDATGKYAKALKNLESQAKLGVESVAWNVALAEALEKVGRYEEATVAIQRAVKKDPLWPMAILVQGRLLETVGKKAEALEVYGRMSDVMAQDSLWKDAPTLVILGKIFDRTEILKGKKSSDQATNILHNYLQESYQKDNEKYWPGNVAAGDFLLSKHRASGAAVEYGLALKSNKNCVEAIVGQAAIQLEQWQFENCMGAVNRALKINPNHHDALLVKASCYMLWRKFSMAPPIIQKVLNTNPNHIEALSLMAAAHMRMFNDKLAGPYVDRVDKINSNSHQLPTIIAEWLAA
ncbi:MAG TPA: hypothetical protein ENL03_04545, partial [Phycisphaerae bacterium]|nr:hypothetical protein [Phycisphaerae bacterium]